MISEIQAITTALKVETQESVEALTKLIVSQFKSEEQSEDKVNLMAALRCLEEAVIQLEKVLVSEQE